MGVGWCGVGDNGGSDLRDGVLCKREVLHQHIQPLVVFIQELPHPPVGKSKRKIHSEELALKITSMDCAPRMNSGFFLFFQVEISSSEFPVTDAR